MEHTLDPGFAGGCAHADVWRQVGAVAEPATDGVALLEHLASGGAAHDGVAIAAADHPRLAAPG